MKIIKQILEKNLDLNEEFTLRKFEIRAIWKWFVIYNISLSIIGAEDPYLNKKNRLWRSLLSSMIKGKLNLSVYSKLQNLMRQGNGIIIRALRMVDEVNESMGLDKGDFWNEKSLAMVWFEFESD